MKRLARQWKALRKLVYLYPFSGLSAVFVAGAMFWGGFNWSLEVTNTESFCISCHAMKEYIFEDFKNTTHYADRTGVRASCPDCHVPREWIHKVVRKIRASNEVVHWLGGSIDSPEDFEAKRSALARDVWASMEATDSRECRNCHGIKFMTDQAQTAEARTMHALADAWGETCIDCHKGIAHSLPRDYDGNAHMDALHERIEREEIDCRVCHQDMAAPPPGEGW